MEAVETVLDRHRRDSPRFDATPWREVFDSADSPLTITEHRTYPWQEPVTLEGLKGRVLSYSYIAVLGEQERATVAHEIGELVSINRGIRATDDTALVLKHHTEVYVARRARIVRNHHRRPARAPGLAGAEAQARPLAPTRGRGESAGRLSASQLPRV